MGLSPSKCSLKVWIPLLFFGIFLLNSCALKIENVEAPILQPEKFSYSEIEVIPDKWWVSFEDPALNTVMEEVLKFLN
jgi:hypothetical protein